MYQQDFKKQGAFGIALNIMERTHVYISKWNRLYQKLGKINSINSMGLQTGAIDQLESTFSQTRKDMN